MSARITVIVSNLKLRDWVSIELLVDWAFIDINSNSYSLYHLLPIFIFLVKNGFTFSKFLNFVKI
jgi:hypothetical protein